MTASAARNYAAFRGSALRVATADRIRKVIAVVPPERVYLTTDCGMKPLTRMVAAMKLKALAEGAALVRAEMGERR